MGGWVAGGDAVPWQRVPAAVPRTLTHPPTPTPHQAEFHRMLRITELSRTVSKENIAKTSKSGGWRGRASGRAGGRLEGRRCVGTTWMRSQLGGRGGALARRGALARLTCTPPRRRLQPRP